MGFRARPSEENGFLLATTPGPADRGVVGKLSTGSDDFGVGLLLVDGEFCRINSQLSARITRIRTVESTFRGPWIRLRFRTPRSRPLHAIHDPLGKGLAVVRIHLARDFQGCWSTGKRTRTWHMCMRLRGGRSFSGCK